ncbi:hypothetical protein BC833DRAFT_596416 [Globomyces pollinis-pini]|nr:hypothetical protein BC833DRAFT_596416 [Globomyces pollinis-pini]
MSTDFLLPFAILNCGIGLAKCDYRKLSKGKIIPWFSLGALVTAFCYCLAGTYTIMYKVTPDDVYAFRTIAIVQNLCDFLTTVFLEYCYFIRLAAFITNKNLRTVLFIYLPVLLLVYSSCCIAGVMLAFKYPVSDYVYQAAYNGGNLTLALTNFMSHFFLCHSLMTTLHAKSIEVSTWEVYLPVITTIGLGGSAICGLRISTLGTGLVYSWWTLDILSFFAVNSLIVKYLSLDTITSGTSSARIAKNSVVPNNSPVHERRSKV